MDKCCDTYRDFQEIRRITEIYERQDTIERILAEIEKNKKKRREEYQKYRSIWY